MDRQSSEDREDAMKRPTIWIVLEVSGDRYHLWNKEPIAWFFDEAEANDWINDHPNRKSIELTDCPGVE